MLLVTGEGEFGRAEGESRGVTLEITGGRCVSGGVVFGVVKGRLEF